MVLEPFQRQMLSHDPITATSFDISLYHGVKCIIYEAICTA